MTTTDINNKPSAAVDASNVIPFPDRRAAQKQPEKTESRTFSLRLRQAMRKVKDAVLCFARNANTVRVQRKRVSAAASAAHCTAHHQPTPQHHDGSAVRKRMSA